jgi:uncharacterized protein DUF2877
VSGPPFRPVVIGTAAHAAVVRARGEGRVLARSSASTYLTVGDEIVWLGVRGATPHPRAILTARVSRPDEDDVRIEIGTLAPWRPAALALDGVAASNLTTGWRDLSASTLGTPLGFGALLAGRPLAFPLDGVREAADALARACARGDAARAADAALALLGVGGGLTPSGDDYVGGVLFARALLAAARPDDAAAWRRAADRVLARAPACTHPISAALLGDLVAGQSWAPLHELVAALAAGTPRAAHAAARRLVALGHTSGWDMLAGVGAGLGVLAC